MTKADKGKPSGDSAYTVMMKAAEKDIIAWALRQSPKDTEEAARILGMTRRSLYRRATALGIRYLLNESNPSLHQTVSSWADPVKKKRGPRRSYPRGPRVTVAPPPVAAEPAPEPVPEAVSTETTTVFQRKEDE